MRAIVELEECLMAQLETFFKVDLFQLKTAKDHYDQLSVEKAALVEPALAPPNHRYKAEKSLRRAALHYGDQIQILQSSKSAIVRSLDQLFNITAKDIEVINKIYPTTQKRVQVKEGPSEPNQAQLAEETEERQKPMLSLELTSDSMQKLQMSGPPSGMGPQHSQQGQRMEPRKIITSVSFTNELQLNKSQKAWKHGLRKANKVVDDSEAFNTQELFCKVRSILNKLTPQMFQQLMRQVTELTIDTEEQLQGVIDLIFEKAISEPNFCVTYANMCHCLMKLNVTSTDKPGVTVTFRTLLLNRCQKEFEKDKDDNEVFEKKQKELDTSLMDEEKQRLCEELQEAKGQARRRSLGNIKFIGELFKVKMLTENTMHVCIVKLLKNHNEESMECLCRLLSTIGKDLDCEKATPRMDQYFSQMEQIIKERKTSSRIRFMLQDVLDLRRNKYVPRRGEQCPKTIDQIRKDAELEEHREQIKVQQQLMNKKGNRRGGPGGPHPAAGLRTSRTTAWRSGAPDAWECNSRARRQGGGRLKHGWH